MGKQQDTQVNRESAAEQVNQSLVSYTIIHMHYNE